MDLLSLINVCYHQSIKKLFLFFSEKQDDVYMNDTLM